MTEKEEATAPEGDGDQNVDELSAETLAEEEYAKAKESVNIDEEKVEGEMLMGREQNDEGHLVDVKEMGEGRREGRYAS